MNMRWHVRASFLFLVSLQFVFGAVPEVFAAENADAGNLHLAVSVQGQVVVKRKGWISYAPVVFGTYLQPGDLLRVEGDSLARIVCSDLTLHDVPVGVTGVPCERSRPLLQRPGGSIIHTPRSSPPAGSFPQVLSPRRTKLLSATPVLRWTPVAGVAGYRVIVRGGGSAWSEDVQSSIEISYPDLAPQLKPGIDYKLIVETGDRSSYEPGFDLGFSILDPKDRKRVLQEEKQIENLSLPDEPTQFLIAHLYASYGLRAEAIEKLEAVSQKFKAAAVAALLGDLYASTGLIRQSEASYLNAVELAKNENDEIGSMLAHLALGRIYQQELGSANAAITHFDSALALANRLGDNLTAAEAGEKLAELRKTGTR
jgi:hypothetical protein